MTDTSAPTGPRARERRLFVAIDRPDRDGAVGLGRRLAEGVGASGRIGLKLGLEFVTACGPDGVAAVAASGLPLFLDLKFHDIPNTVAGAVRATCRVAAPLCLTVHASGGPAMLRAAVEAAGRTGTTVLGVTVLTSLDDGALASVGQTLPTSRQVDRLARLAAQTGCGGVVCSPMEAALARRAIGPDRTIVTPGVRPRGSDVGDQRRVMTPAEAIAAGADHLVVGRPITGAGDPVAAARNILADMGVGATSIFRAGVVHSIQEGSDRPASDAD